MHCILFTAVWYYGQDQYIVWCGTSDSGLMYDPAVSAKDDAPIIGVFSIQVSRVSRAPGVRVSLVRHTRWARGRMGRPVRAAFSRRD